MSTTFRQLVRSGLFVPLQAYQQANPTLLVSVYDHRPPSFNPPIAFVAGISEPSIRHDSGIRTRHAVGQVMVVHRPADNDSTSDQMDILIDGLVDAFSAVPHTVTGAILTGEMSAEDAEVALGGHRGANESGVVYVSTIISVHVEIYEGRN